MSEGCNNLPTISHGWIPMEERKDFYNLHESVRFQCNLGYGSSKFSVECIGPNEWSKESCRPLSCGDPTRIENADLIGSLFTFPNFVTYKCHEGYQIVGKDTLYCGANGKWLTPPLPSCEPVQCPRLDNPENGNVNYNFTTYLSEAHYSCNRGFRLIGNEKRLCESNGLWSGDSPLCEEILCSPPVSYGIYKPKKQNYKIGDFVLYQCDDGSWKSGKCQRDGTWTARICPGPVAPELAGPGPVAPELAGPGPVAPELVVPRPVAPEPEPVAPRPDSPHQAEPVPPPEPPRPVPRPEPPHPVAPVPRPESPHLVAPVPRLEPPHPVAPVPRLEPPHPVAPVPRLEPLYPVAPVPALNIFNKILQSKLFLICVVVILFIFILRQVQKKATQHSEFEQNKLYE